MTLLESNRVRRQYMAAYWRGWATSLFKSYVPFAAALLLGALLIDLLLPGPPSATKELGIVFRPWLIPGVGLLILTLIGTICNSFVPARWVLSPEGVRIRGGYFLTIPWTSIASWLLTPARDAPEVLLLSIARRRQWYDFWPRTFTIALDATVDRTSVSDCFTERVAAV